MLVTNSSNTIKEKILGIFSFVSGITGIVSFTLDYPDWAFFLVFLFVIGAFLYFGNEIKELSAQSGKSQGSKVQFWFTAITRNQIARLFVSIAIIIVIQTGIFFYREATFLWKQGWVGEINYEYSNGMSPVHLASQPQDDRSLNVIKVIDPVIYHYDRYTISDDKIRFEGRDESTGDFDFGYFSVEVAGYDPKNTIVEATGNFVLNSGEQGYMDFDFGDHYTYFIRFDNPNTGNTELVRLHIFDNSWKFFGRASEMSMKVFVSNLYGSGSRFDGLLSK